MAVISGVALIKSGWMVGGGGGGRGATGLQLKKTPRGTPSSSHIPNKPPHQSQTTTEDKANV